MIDAAFDAQLTINLTAEFEKALKNYTLRTVALNIKWKEFPEVKDLDRALFEYIPIMVTTFKGSIGALLSAAASFCEPMNSCANQIVTTGNTSLGDDDLVDKTVTLRMNKNFMNFMNLNYPLILKQRFPTFGTVIFVEDNEQDDVEMDYE